MMQNLYAYRYRYLNINNLVCDHLIQMKNMEGYFVFNMGHTDEVRREEPAKPGEHKNNDDNKASVIVLMNLYMNLCVCNF